MKILSSKADCTSYTFLVLFLYLTIQYYVCEFQYTDYSKPKEGRYLKQYNFSIFLGVLYSSCTIFFILLNINVLNQTIKDGVFLLLFFTWVISTIYSIASVTSDSFEKMQEVDYYYSNGYKLIYVSNNALFFIFLLIVVSLITNSISNCCKKQNFNNYFRA